MNAATRAKLMEAMLELVVERGYEATGVGDVARLAGVTPADFDRCFASKEDCAIAVFDHFRADFEVKVRGAYAREPTWPDNLRAASYAIARWARENPRGMRFGTVEMMWVSEAAQAQRVASFEAFLGMIEAGRAVAPDPDAVPADTAGRLMGSIAEILTRRLQREGFDPEGFVPELMALIVGAYLGEEAGARELAIPPPTGWSAAEAGQGGVSSPCVAKGGATGDAKEDGRTGGARLPRGRHGLPRELVAENQRRRLVAAIIAVVAEDGYAETTITTIVAEAGLSRKTFYEHFKNKEDCFATAYEAGFAYLRAEIAAVDGTGEAWGARVRARIGRLLEMLAAEPQLASFFLIAPASVGEPVALRHHEAMRELVGELVAGAPRGRGRAGSGRTREQALAGGISRLVVRRLDDGEAEKLPRLEAAISELVLRPYVGDEEAARIADGGE